MATAVLQLDAPAPYDRNAGALAITLAAAVSRLRLTGQWRRLLGADLTASVSGDDIGSSGLDDPDADVDAHVNLKEPW
jgi:hypothetical protein